MLRIETEQDTEIVETATLKKLNIDFEAFNSDDDSEFQGTVHIYFMEYVDGKRQITCIADQNGGQYDAGEFLSWGECLEEAIACATKTDDIDYDIDNLMESLEAVIRKEGLQI